MVLEVAILNITPDNEAAFEAAMCQARPLISATPGFRSIELRRCVENSGRYLLLVKWDSVEDHEVGFRKSERYAEWRTLLHHFYSPIKGESCPSQIISSR